MKGHWNSPHEAQRLRVVGGTAASPTANMHAGTVRAKKAPLVWSRCRDLLLIHAPHVTQANWKSTDDVGNHDQNRLGALLRTASFRLGESLL